MTEFLVLRDFGTSSSKLRAGSIVDDAVVPVAELQAQGLAAVEATADVKAAAVVSQKASRGVDLPAYLSSYLPAEGLLGGGGEQLVNVVDPAWPYEAKAGERVIQNQNDATARQLDLPPNPSIGDVVELYNNAATGMAPVTVDRNTNLINNGTYTPVISGELPSSGWSGINHLGGARFEFVGGAVGWQITVAF